MLRRFRYLALLAIVVAGCARSRCPCPPRAIAYVGVAAEAKSPSAQAARRGGRTATKSTRPRPTGQAAKAKAARGAAASSSADEYDVISVQFDTEANLRALGVQDVTRLSNYGRFGDFFVPSDGRADAALEAVMRAEGFLRYEYLEVGIAPPQPSPGLSKVGSMGRPDRIVRGGLDGLTGKGVVIAIVDSGLDFRHPDFWVVGGDGQKTSRILRFWDPSSDLHRQGVGKPGPARFPNGEPIGTVFSREDLTRELRSGEQRISPVDEDGHGTSCAGIAAGNGNGSENREHVGVAPEADIVAVRVDGGWDEDGVFENSYLLGTACNWLDEVAGERPLVVSCSFGGQYDAHDGMRLDEMRLDEQFSARARGRVLCFAAGNEGASPIHASATVGPQQDARRYEIEGGPPADSGRTLRVEVYLHKVPEGVEWMAGYDGMELVEFTEETRTRPEDVQLVLTFRGAGGWFSLWTTSGERFNGDAYVYRAQFAAGTADYEHLVGTPGTSTNAVTVGSYDWNDVVPWFTQPVLTWDDKQMTIGDLSSYSSPGYQRGRGAVKPDVVAPGQWFIAPHSSEATRGNHSLDPDGRYGLFNGTSAATPYVAGVLALLLQKSPRLTLGEIRSSLRESARGDRFTGPRPNPRWGYGKLDFVAARKLLGGS